MCTLNLIWYPFQSKRYIFSKYAIMHGLALDRLRGRSGHTMGYYNSAIIRQAFPVTIMFIKCMYQGCDSSGFFVTNFRICSVKIKQFYLFSAYLESILAVLQDFLARCQSHTWCTTPMAMTLCFLIHFTMPSTDIETFLKQGRKAQAHTNQFDIHWTG